MSMRYRPTCNQRGLTVIELVIVVGLSLVLLAALLRFLVIGFPLSKVTYLQARSTELARHQLKRVTRALREAQRGDTGAYPLVEAQPNRLVFYSDVDADDVTERIRYELVDTTLQRGVTEPSGDPVAYDVNTETVTTVATSIRNDPTTEPLFTYYTEDYPEDTTPLSPSDLTEVKYISLQLIVDIDLAHDPDPVSIITQVQLRNLKTNLGESVEEE